MIFVFILLVVIFAISRELIEQQDPYIFAVPRRSDSVKKLIKKVRTCVKSPFFIIYWRQNFITSQLITLFVFYILLKRFPTTQEYLLSIIGVFTILSWATTYHIYFYNNRSVVYINKALNIIEKKLKL